MIEICFDCGTILKVIAFTLSSTLDKQQIFRNIENFQIPRDFEYFQFGTSLVLHLPHLSCLLDYPPCEMHIKWMKQHSSWPICAESAKAELQIDESKVCS